MNKELIINVHPQGVEIALLEDKKLVELHTEKTDARFAVGDLYLGKVKKLIPGLNAAFVDVGFEKDQWIWRPAIGREQRIALQDRSTRFFGTDFSFEDLEERDVAQFDYKLLGEEGGAWKLESTPRK